MLIAVKDLPGFTEFVKQIFGATLQVRNNGENILLYMPAGLITGTKNGLFYNLMGDRDLVKNVVQLWMQALQATENASTCTTNNGDEK